MGSRSRAARAGISPKSELPEYVTRSRSPSQDTLPDPKSAPELCQKKPAASILSLSRELSKPEHFPGSGSRACAVRISYSELEPELEP